MTADDALFNPLPTVPLAITTPAPVTPLAWMDASLVTVPAFVTSTPAVSPWITAAVAPAGPFTTVPLPSKYVPYPALAPVTVPALVKVPVAPNTTPARPPPMVPAASLVTVPPPFRNTAVLLVAAETSIWPKLSTASLLVCPSTVPDSNWFAPECAAAAAPFTSSASFSTIVATGFCGFVRASPLTAVSSVNTPMVPLCVVTSSTWPGATVKAPGPSSSSEDPLGRLSVLVWSVVTAPASPKV